jgi:hypothetical protein
MSPIDPQLVISKTLQMRYFHLSAFVTVALSVTVVNRLFIGKERRGRRQEAEGRRQEAEGRRQHLVIGSRYLSHDKRVNV